MAQATLADYFGQTLEANILNSASPLAIDLNISEADAIDPDRLFAAIYLRIRNFLIVDGTNDNGIQMDGFGQGGKMGQTVGDTGRYGYQDQITFWVENQNNPNLQPEQVY